VIAPVHRIFNFVIKVLEILTPALLSLAYSTCRMYGTVTFQKLAPLSFIALHLVCFSLDEATVVTA